MAAADRGVDRQRRVQSSVLAFDWRPFHQGGRIFPGALLQGGVDDEGGRDLQFQKCLVLKIKPQAVIFAAGEVGSVVSPPLQADFEGLTRGCSRLPLISRQ